MRRHNTHPLGTDHLLQQAAPIRNLPAHWTKEPIVIGWIELSCEPLQIGPWLSFSTASIVVARCMYSGAILYMSPCFDDATPTPAEVMSAALSHVATTTKQVRPPKRTKEETSRLTKRDPHTAVSDDHKAVSDPKHVHSIRQQGER